MKKLKREKDGIGSILFRSIFCANCILFLTIIFSLGIGVFSSVIDFYEESRVEVLQQINERIKIINNVAEHIAENIYEEYGEELVKTNALDYESVDKVIDTLLAQDDDMCEALQLDPSVIIIMKGGYEYIEVEEYVMVENVKVSTWYMENFSNDRDQQWIVRFSEVREVVKTNVTYAKVIRSEEGEYEGVILVSVTENSLNSIFSEIEGGSTIMYILDENGQSISHSIENLIGLQLYYMPIFFENYTMNGSSYVDKNVEDVVMTTYYDTETSWTIVEETTIASLVSSYSHLIIIFVILLIIVLLITAVASYMVTRIIAKPIRELSNELVISNSNNFSPIKLREEYKEIYILSNIYNMSVAKIIKLIEEMKSKEREKRDMEISFLQAQINPHFMHNTLFVIKCAVEMEKYERADHMLSDLMKLLKVPLTINHGWILVKNEIEYIKNYLSLIQNRDEGKKIELIAYCEVELLELYIPRLMLQPIVENAIMHGLEGSENAQISINITGNDDNIFVRINDNGCGMNLEEVKNIWSNTNGQSSTFNRIGLKNIRGRLQLLFGEGYDITILSEKNIGTEVILKMKKIQGDEDIENINS